MSTAIRSTAEGLLDLIYPPKCAVCGALNPFSLCESCLEAVERMPYPSCPRCGQPATSGRCRNCWGRVVSFTAARAAGKFEGVLREVIHRFKYGGARVLADPLAYALHQYLTTGADFPWERAECVVPVPIHPARQRIRGYNQSELVAERLSKKIERPIIGDAVIRNRLTRPQVELSGDARRMNVKAAFSISKPEEIRKKTVLLVDDVATTCSTLHECSLAMMAAGAAGVYVACVAFDA